MPTGNYNLSQRNYRVENEHYALVPKADIPRSTFMRKHEHKTTANAGFLIPILIDEVLPGDVHTSHITVFARISNLLFPLMDNARLDTQFFFVPNRLVWDNWKRFMGEQPNPGDSISFTVPQYGPIPAATDIRANGATLINDYMGIPQTNWVTPQTVNVNALPFRAYNLIWNEWYRDENLQTSTTVAKGDGPDAYSTYQLRRRGKKHDYFTSALPFPQKGNAVSLPLAGTAPIIGLGPQDGTTPGGGTVLVRETSGVNVSYPSSYTGDQLFALANTVGTTRPQIFADLSSATGATINALRLAVQTQKLLERDARGGTRYTELLRQHFGVTPQDARLQRPEYIGGGSTFIQTAAIAQTSATAVTGSTTPLGGLAGQSTIAGQHHYSMVAQEHGYIIGLMSLMTTPTYQQGLSRMWTRQTRYDFAWPEFTAIGEQSVRNDEIYVQGTSDDLLTFGYQERYAEYRFVNNRVSGLFRSTTAGTIDPWHLAQKFSSLPTLGETFIEEQAPWERVLAAGSTANAMQYLADILFETKTTRALPAYGVPGSLPGTF